eukprot:scaffold126502_cov47-Cyclotella_meneghiniana.AAC.2
MATPLPPPHINHPVAVVGFTANNNQRSCINHACCGDSLILQSPNDGVGLQLRTSHTPSGDIECRYVSANGIIGCRVAFISKDYIDTAGLDGATVEIVDTYTTRSQLSYQRRLFYSHKGYAWGNIIAFGK